MANTYDKGLGNIITESGITTESGYESMTETRGNKRASRAISLGKKKKDTIIIKMK